MLSMKFFQLIDVKLGSSENLFPLFRAFWRSHATRHQQHSLQDRVAFGGT